VSSHAELSSAKLRRRARDLAWQRRRRQPRIWNANRDIVEVVREISLLTEEAATAPLAR
jgi:hypothetical protein